MTGEALFLQSSGILNHFVMENVLNFDNIQILFKEFYRKKYGFRVVYMLATKYNLRGESVRIRDTKIKLLN